MRSCRSRSACGLASGLLPKAESQRGESCLSFKPRHQQLHRRPNLSHLATCSRSYAAAGVGMEWDGRVGIRWCFVFASSLLRLCFFFASSSPLPNPLCISIIHHNASTRVYPAKLRPHSSKWACREESILHSRCAT